MQVQASMQGSRWRHEPCMGPGSTFIAIIATIITIIIISQSHCYCS